MSKHNVHCWVINTGWTGGKFGTGSRCTEEVRRGGSFAFVTKKTTNFGSHCQCQGL